MHCVEKIAYPCRYVDLVPRFGRPVSQLSMVTLIVVDHIYDTFAHLLTILDQPWLSQNNAQLFVAALWMEQLGLFVDIDSIKEQCTMATKGCLH